MAGRGPAPKDPSTRVRRNAPPVADRTIAIQRSAQPGLADLLGDYNPVTGEPWSAATADLLKSVGEFYKSEPMHRTQWHLLARAMVLDDAFVRGQMKAETALRQWIAQFPAFPTDLLRHRITTVEAEKAEASRKTPTTTKRSPAKKKSARAGLYAV
jgi:hypothetical protein